MSIVNSTSTKISANKTELKKALAKMMTNFISNKKWSDKDAASELDVKQTMIPNLAKGIVKNISLDDILELFKKFGYESSQKKSSIPDIIDLTLTKEHI